MGDREISTPKSPPDTGSRLLAGFLRRHRLTWFGIVCATLAVVGLYLSGSIDDYSNTLQVIGFAPIERAC